MDAKIIALACSLIAVACSSSRTRPAQDASSGANAPPGTTAASDTIAAPGTQNGTTTASQPVTSTAQFVNAPTDHAGEPRLPDDKKAAGASSSVTAKSASPTIETKAAVVNTTQDANNTRINARDRNDSLTPMSQGNSAAETRITADIRKGIMDSKVVTFTGKNVKIITVGTKVTLRGPVKSGTERATIEDIAKRTAGVSNVDNQLEIVN